MDDAVMAGRQSELEGGKRGRFGPNKTPFVAAVASSDDGHPLRLLLHVVKAHDGDVIEAIARAHLAPDARVISATLANPPRRTEAARITVQQQRRQHPRIERRLAERTRLATSDLREIQALADQRQDEPRQVVLRHVVLHVCRQELRLIDLPGAKVLAHGNQKQSDAPTKFYQLLGQAPSKAYPRIDGQSIG
jgi:hypothetical protein